MIDEYWTFRFFGYTSDSLSYGSGKKVIVMCDGCWLYRSIAFHQYRDLCKSCTMKTSATRKKISIANKGRKRSDEVKEQMRLRNLGNRHSEETKRKMSKSMRGKVRSKEHATKLAEAHRGHRHTEESKRKISDGVKKRFIENPEILKKMSNSLLGTNNPFYGKKHTKETRILISSAMQNIPINDWDGFNKHSPYCEKFNNEFKERIRNKYNRLCFLCSATELSNGKRLSVHHVNYYKNCLCDDVNCEFVPLCKKCHTKTNTNRLFWERLFIYAIRYYNEEKELECITITEMVQLIG